MVDICCMVLVVSLLFFSIHLVGRLHLMDTKTTDMTQHERDFPSNHKQPQRYKDSCLGIFCENLWMVFEVCHRNQGGHNAYLANLFHNNGNSFEKSNKRFEPPNVWRCPEATPNHPSHG